MGNSNSGQSKPKKDEVSKDIQPSSSNLQNPADNLQNEQNPSTEQIQQRNQQDDQINFDDNFKAPKISQEMESGSKKRSKEYENDNSDQHQKKRLKTSDNHLSENLNFKNQNGLHELFDVILEQNEDKFKEKMEIFKELFKKDKKFESEMKYLSNCRQQVDLINKRLNENFNILFEDIEAIKKLAQSDLEMKRYVVIGCALYETLIQDNQIQDRQQIIVPAIFKKPKENIFTILKSLLQVNTEENIIKFNEAVKSNEDELMKIDLFDKQLRYLIKCQKKVELINKRFQEEFQMIFGDKNDLKLQIQEENQQSEKIIIGCALYAKISQDSRITEVDKITVPTLLKSSSQFQKYNKFLQLKLMSEDDQGNLIDIQESFKKIYKIINEKESYEKEIRENLKEIQDCIEIFDVEQQTEIKNLLFQASQELSIEQFYEQDFFKEQKLSIQEKDLILIQKQAQLEAEKEQLLKAEEEERQRSLKQLELQKIIEIENILRIQQEQEEQEKLKIKNQIVNQFDQDPLKFLQAVIDKPQNFKEIDIEKLIKQKYFDGLMFEAQEAFETTLVKLTS